MVNDKPLVISMKAARRGTRRNRLTCSGTYSDKWFFVVMITSIIVILVFSAGFVHFNSRPVVLRADGQSCGRTKMILVYAVLARVCTPRDAHASVCEHWSVREAVWPLRATELV